MKCIGDGRDAFTGEPRPYRTQEQIRADLAEREAYRAAAAGQIALEAAVSQGIEAYDFPANPIFDEMMAERLAEPASV